MAKNFVDVNELMVATKEQLISISDIGEIVADCIVTYFADKENIDQINKLFDLGVNIKYQREKAQGVFSNEKVVLTGTLTEFKRDQASKIIESLDKFRRIVYNNNAKLSS